MTSEKKSGGGEARAEPEKSDASRDEATDSAPEKQVAKKDPVRRITLIVLAIAIVIFVWYVLADRYAPWTDQARVKAFIVPIVPQVSGVLTEVNVDVNQVVEPNQVLVRINPSDYELAVQKAEAALERAGQEIGASTEAVASAQARVVDAQAQLDYARKQSDRLLKLADKGVISRADADKTRTEVTKAKAELDRANSELRKAREQLGKEGEDNPRIREAIASLKQARIDLERTTIRSPTLGVITDLRVDVGHYANVGQPLMTFGSSTDVWVQANLRENSLGNVKEGDRAEIVLDVAPGRVFRGTVSSIGYGVGHGDRTATLGELSMAEGKTGWLRDAQRFPVIIHFDDNSAVGLRRAGGRADVQIYTGDHPVLNALGRLWIRLMAVLSYVY
ncbi:MAG: HlyD family secretion protein [Pseudomonadota bacterium]|nr:HlyD family secretion protein [Pseudomonadota bacterium]